MRKSLLKVGGKSKSRQALGSKKPYGLSVCRHALAGSRPSHPVEPSLLETIRKQR